MYDSCVHQEGNDTRIRIIGAGNIGSTAVRAFAGAGQWVVAANSRIPETLGDLVAKVGPNARAETVEEATDLRGVVMKDVPFGRYRDKLRRGLQQVGSCTVQCRLCA